MVRGSDEGGSAANFVETEQIVEVDAGKPNQRQWTSFLQVIPSEGLNPNFYLVSRLYSIALVSKAQLEMAASTVYASSRRSTRYVHSAYDGFETTLWWIACDR
jgi:hypothetical protein